MLWLDPGPPFRTVIMIALAALVSGEGGAVSQEVELWRQRAGEVKVRRPRLLSRACALPR